MPAKDIYHNAVKNALIKDDWKITKDPLILEYGGKDLFVDLGAEKLISAEKGNQKIAVEIKSFIGTSALPQYCSVKGERVCVRVKLTRTQCQKDFLLLGCEG